MKETKKQKQISIIIPNCSADNFGEVEEKISKTIPEGYEAVYIFVHKDKKEIESDQTHIFVSCPEKLSLNSQITLGFSYAQGDCAIVCNTESDRYDEYVKEMIFKWQTGAKIVRTHQSQPTSFWGKVGNFFAKIKNAMFNAFLRLCGLSSDSLCINSFQLFDKQVYTLIKSLPEKNSYLRNCLELRSFETVQITTNENVKLKDNGLKWNTKLIVSASMLGLFVVFFVLSFVLYPIAKQRSANFTFVSLMILICLGLVFGTLGFFFSAVFDSKMGYDQQLNTLLPKTEPIQTEEISEDEASETELETEDIKTKKSSKKSKKNKKRTQTND